MVKKRDAQIYVNFERLEEKCLQEETALLERAAGKYGYQVTQSDDKIYLWTKYEAWYYYYDYKNGFMRLMHGNTPGRRPNGWHNQRIGKRYSPEELVEFVHGHEEYVYVQGRTYSIQSEIRKRRRKKRRI